MRDEREHLGGRRCIAFGRGILEPRVERYSLSRRVAPRLRHPAASISRIISRCEAHPADDAAVLLPRSHFTLFYAGFTVTTWIVVKTPGPVFTLGTQGAPDQPDDWDNTRSEFFRLDVGIDTVSVSWARKPQGEFTGRCPNVLSSQRWSILGFSVSASGDWKIQQGSTTCSGTSTIPIPARLWPRAVVGGGSFSGWLAHLNVYDDYVAPSAAMTALANGDGTRCTSTTAPPAPWVDGLAVSRVWASTLATSGCTNPATGAPAACDASSVVNRWPADNGGCGANGVVTAGGVDSYPAITLDLGYAQYVSSVRLYRMGPDRYASYAVLIGNVAPPDQGEPLTMPFPSTFANKPCLVQDPYGTALRGRIANLTCEGFGRYVTVQLLASDGAGVMRVCQMQAFGYNATSPPSSYAATRTSSFAANWDVNHRYGPSVDGNALIDTGNAQRIAGAMTGTTAADDGSIVFSGSHPCVRFDQPISPPSEFSFVVRFTAPSVIVPHATSVIWEGSGTRLYISANDTTAAGQLDLAYGDGHVARGGVISPSSVASAAIVCSGGVCSVTRGM